MDLKYPNVPNNLSHSKILNLMLKRNILKKYLILSKPLEKN